RVGRVISELRISRADHFRDVVSRDFLGQTADIRTEHHSTDPLLQLRSQLLRRRYRLERTLVRDAAFVFDKNQYAVTHLFSVRPCSSVAKSPRLSVQFLRQFCGARFRIAVTEHL